jgi:hypothetical protein
MADLPRTATSAKQDYRPHPRFAEVVRFIFRRYAEGASQFRIASEVAAKGILTSGGKPTRHANKIGRLLDNPAYASLMPLDAQLVAGNWEPLVEPAPVAPDCRAAQADASKWSRPRAAKRLLRAVGDRTGPMRSAIYQPSGSPLDVRTFSIVARSAFAMNGFVR